MRITEGCIIKLLDRCSSEQIKSIQKLFWDTVCKTNYTPEHFRKLLPNWCKAIDELPNTENLSRVNDICLEVMLDVIEEVLN